MPELNFTADPSMLDENEWGQFVQSHPDGNIFYSPEIFKAYSKTLGFCPVILACLDNNNSLKGIIVGVIQESKTRHLRPFTSRCIIWGGPLIKDGSLAITDQLLAEFDRITSKKAVYTQFRNLGDSENKKPIFENRLFKFENHLDILVNLTKGEKNLWQELHPTRRKQISRSIKRGCSIEVLDSPDQNSLRRCHELLKDTYSNIGLPYPSLQFFEHTFYVLNKKNFIRVFLASFEEEIIGFRFVLVFKGLIYDWYAASDREHKDKYPNDQLPWFIINWGVKNGYTLFDFGGAGKPNESYGVRDYKLKFGGELVNYGRFTKINKPFYYYLGTVGLKLIKSLKIKNALL